MFNNEFLFFLPTDDTNNTNLFSLSPDEPDEPDGWRNVLFCQRMTRRTRIFFLRSLASSVVFLTADNAERHRNFFLVLLLSHYIFLRISAYSAVQYFQISCTFISSCPSCSPLATPSRCPMFHAPFLYLYRWKVRGVGLDGKISKQPVRTQ